MAGSPSDNELAYRTAGELVGLRQRWRLLFRDFDIVLCPPMPTAAFPHAHSARWERHLDIDGATVPYGDQIAWAGIAIRTGFPATAAPIARSPDRPQLRRPPDRRADHRRLSRRPDDDRLCRAAGSRASPRNSEN
jgi:Asp-tRNA(Asn)/Glu-tRNA(Gln) amidotransferase A subunit family amidase